MDDPDGLNGLHPMQTEVNHLVELNENLDWSDQITLDDSRTKTKLDVFFNDSNKNFD